jgi:hypothetical protein
MTRLPALCLAVVFMASAHAATPAQIEYAVNQVLAREDVLFVDVRLADDGSAIVLFGSNEPAWRVKKAVEALQSHPDIPGLIWSQIDATLCPVR